MCVPISCQRALSSASTPSIRAASAVAFNTNCDSARSMMQSLFSRISTVKPQFSGETVGMM